MSKSIQDESITDEPSRWQENHGNFLLGVSALILLMGGTIIACRQAKIVPPGFRTITVAADDDDLLAEQALQAGEVGPRQTVAVRVVGAMSDEGAMKLAVYVSPEGFNDPAAALGTDDWTIRDGVCEGKFGLPADVPHVAIAAYHDANRNDRLDRNALGIPSERYGFTNNARGVTGPPTFEDAVVPITDQPIEISIR